MQSHEEHPHQQQTRAEGDALGGGLSAVVDVGQTHQPDAPEQVLGAIFVAKEGHLDYHDPVVQVTYRYTSPGGTERNEVVGMLQ